MPTGLVPLPRSGLVSNQAVAPNSGLGVVQHPGLTPSGTATQIPGLTLMAPNSGPGLVPARPNQGLVTAGVAPMPSAQLYPMVNPAGAALTPNMPSSAVSRQAPNTGPGLLPNPASLPGGRQLPLGVPGGPLGGGGSIHPPTGTVTTPLSYTQQQQVKE